MSKQAQFTAMVKKMATDDKKMVLSLELVGNVEPVALVNVLDMIGEKVVVNLGNPQMAMEFDEEDRAERPGLSVTTDQSGVVTTVSGHSDDNEEDDQVDDDDLYTDDDEGEDLEHDEDDEDEEPSENEENTEDVQLEETEGNTPDPDQQGHEESESNTNDVEDQGAEKQGDAAASIDKEKLEAFILSGQAPAFEEIEFDFPALLERKRTGETWIKIAASIGTSSTKLQAAWSRYKKLVTEHMAKQNGEEPGAA